MFAKQKATSILLAVLCAASLFGCAESQPEETEGIDGIEAAVHEENEAAMVREPVEMQDNAPQAGTATYTGLTAVNSFHCVVGNVLYTVRDSWELGLDDAESNYGTWVTWLDASTGEMGYVCAVEGCAHNTESCNAWTGGRWPSMVPVGEQLVLVTNNYDEWDESNEEWVGPKRGYVETLNLDGTQRTKLADLPEDGYSYFDVVGTDGQKIYGSAWRDTGSEEGIWELGIIDIATGACTTTNSIAPEQRPEGVLDGKLLVQTIEETGGDLEAGTLTYSFTLQLYSLDGSPGATLLEWADSKPLSYRSDGERLYVAENNGDIYYITADGTRTDIDKGEPENKTGDIWVGIQGVFNGKLVVDTLYQNDDLGAVEAESRKAYDVSTGDSTELTLRTSDGWLLMPMYHIGGYIYTCREWRDDGGDYVLMPTDDFLANETGNMRAISA